MRPVTGLRQLLGLSLPDTPQLHSTLLINFNLQRMTQSRRYISRGVNVRVQFPLPGLFHIISNTLKLSLVYFLSPEDSYGAWMFWGRDGLGSSYYLRLK